MGMTLKVNQSRFDFNLMFSTLRICTTEGTKKKKNNYNNNNNCNRALFLLLKSIIIILLLLVIELPTQVNEILLEQD